MSFFYDVLLSMLMFHIERTLRNSAHLCPSPSSSVPPLGRCPCAARRARAGLFCSVGSENPLSPFQTMQQVSARINESPGARISGPPPNWSWCGRVPLPEIGGSLLFNGAARPRLLRQSCSRVVSLSLGHATSNTHAAGNFHGKFCYWCSWKLQWSYSLYTCLVASANGCEISLYSGNGQNGGICSI